MKYLMKYVELEDNKEFNIDKKYFVIDSWNTDIGIWFILEEDKK